MTGRNPVNRKKLPGSKWTAARPVQREKHFLVVDWVRDDTGRPTDLIEIEAVVTGRVCRIDRRELEDPDRWLVGWR
jgi:tryptophan-rich hypothetical protein